MIRAEQKDVISFRKSIAAGASQTFEKQLFSDGTVEEIRVRFYEGNELKMQIRPYIQHKGEKIEDLVNYAKGTDQLLTGNDDYLIMNTVTPFEEFDILKIFVENKDLVNPLTLVVDVSIDYYAGKKRVVGGVMK